MKISGPAGPTAPQTPSRPARASGGFSVASTGGSASPAAAAAAASLSGVGDVSALMALQGVEDPLERRRRAIRRGGGLLDRLDELKLALLAGESGQGALERLSRTLHEQRDDEDETGLKQVLDQIDIRAEVELAKAEVRRSAA